MAKTSAERQAAYRERNRKGIAGADERIDCMVSAETKRALEDLAMIDKVTQRTILERLIADAFKEWKSLLSDPENLETDETPPGNVYDDSSWR